MLHFFYSLAFGFVIDNLGVKTSLILGNVLMVIARFVLVYTEVRKGSTTMLCCCFIIYLRNYSLFSSFNVCQSCICASLVLRSIMFSAVPVCLYPCGHSATSSQSATQTCVFCKSCCSLLFQAVPVCLYPCGHSATSSQSATQTYVFCKSCCD